jgi:hypothetical protein
MERRSLEWVCCEARLCTYCPDNNIRPPTLRLTRRESPSSLLSPCMHAALLMLPSAPSVSTTSLGVFANQTAASLQNSLCKDQKRKMEFLISTRYPDTKAQTTVPETKQFLSDE